GGEIRRALPGECALRRARLLDLLRDGRRGDGRPAVMAVKRVELVDLLRGRKIRHPSSITRLESRGAGDLRVEVKGIPWWEDGNSSATDASATFHFEGISPGWVNVDLLKADPFNEDLKYFDARPRDEV